MNISKNGARAGLGLLATMGLAAGANAGTASANLAVGATVSSNCTLSTSPVAFGTVNAISGSSVDANGAISVICSSGTTWNADASVGSGSGASFSTRKLTSGSNQLSYSLYTDNGYSSVWGDGSTGTARLSGTGTGSAQAVTVYGRIAAGQTGAVPGIYSDSVAVTVTY